MQKTVLLPTDFSIESLNLLHAAVRLGEEEINVVMYHAIHPSDSIVDLLFFSSDKFIDSIAEKAFIDAVNVIRSKYPSVIRSWSIELFTGKSKAAFRNFINGHHADMILVPESYTFRYPHARSADPLRFVDRTRNDVRTVSWPQTTSTHEHDKLSEIFLVNPRMSSN